MLRMNHILIVGGTGTVGSQVLSRLAATGAQVRAMVRNPAAVRLPPQAEVGRGDLTLPETLDSCLKGIDTVLLQSQKSQERPQRRSSNGQQITYRVLGVIAPSLRTQKSSRVERPCRIANSSIVKCRLYPMVSSSPGSSRISPSRREAGAL